MSTYFKVKYGLSLICMCFCIRSTEAQCNVQNRFGPDCDFKCHCMNNEQCNRTTGDCPSGCDFNWVGPACQRRNIVFNATTKTTRHSSNIKPEHWSYRAVDKSLSKCSITNSNTSEKSWWRLWLSSRYHIRSISILTGMAYLGNGDNFKNFQVMVENNTFGRKNNSYSDRDTCYTHSDTRLTSKSIDIACSKTLIGNQIRIQLAMNNVRLVLCDVRIYGECDNGTFGVSCTEKCSSHCKDICNKDYGTCASCKPGWTGSRCNQVCVDGKYGENCIDGCSPFCRNSTVCRKTDGICVSGCSPGYTTDKCNHKCKDGKYGLKCSYNCSSHCLNGSVCKHTNGSCANGCDPGWTGNKCVQECVEGEYGRNCILNCSGNCRNNSMCSKIDGSCPQGCNVGYTGSECNEICLHTNGSCLNGCAPEWSGETCHHESIAEAEQYFGVDSVKVLAAIIAVIVILVVVVAVSYWNREALIERFISLQVWYHRHHSRGENSFHNEIYMNEHVSAECMAGDNADQAISAQNTDPVYANTEFADIYLNEVRGNEFMSQSGQSNTKSNEFTAQNDVGYHNATPTNLTPNAISISELEQFMKDKCLIDGYFQSQFETIATGLHYPTTVAERRRNIHKSRFKKMYPYDHSRVRLKKLPGQPDSDYINASFINGPGRDKAYIASQGPVKENVDDFWRMIWEMDVMTVVVVTNLAENGKMKCIQYWSTKDEVESYGQISVTMKAENVYAELSIREFSLFHQEDVLTKRHMTQFHFTAWPDKGVPKNSSSLLHFWRKVRQNDENKAQTWLVHCSAGVGRTGTFLAMDILFDQGEQTGFIEVYQCVKDLRKQRVNLVQTHEQYILLHKLMLEMFCIPSKPVNVDEFTTKYHQLQEKESKAGKSKLFLEYQTLESALVWPVTRNDRDENRGAAMDTPVESDEFRPILSTYTSGCTNATKAVYIPSYFDLHEFIIAQFHPDFKMETCRLVFEKDISLVVTLPTKQENTYFEQSASEKTPFVVKCSSQIQKGEYIIKDHVLQSQSKKHCFKEIVFKCWSPKSLVPDNPEAMLNLVKEIDLQRQPLSEPTHGRKSILLQCSNGVDRSGLVAVLLNVLDRARVDNEVSIPQIIRQLRHNRKEIIPNFEQYKFCYDVLNCHLESNATYANV